MLATLALRQDGLNKIRKLAGLTTDKDLADRIGVDAATVSRVLKGTQAPGPKFIAGLIEAFGKEWFADLFDVMPDNEPISA